MTQLLKIAGGAATFPQGPPQWPVATAEVTASVNDALTSGQWGIYEGSLLEQTHTRLQEMWGLSHSLLCSSGTIAVELALRGCGVKAGDEVILAGYDFPGNFRAIEAIGAVPVLVDVIQDGWTMDPAEVALAISPQTRAVLVSHLHGQTASVEQIVKVVADAQADARGDENGTQLADIRIVEDLCQSPGGMIYGKMLGTFGDAVTLSFGGSKLLSAGRGGAVLCDDPAIEQRMKVFAHRGNDAFPFSQIQAALLLPQLEMLHQQNQIRLAAAAKIAAAITDLANLNSLSPAAFEPQHCPAFYKLPIMVRADAGFNRAEFLAAIQPEGIAIDGGFRGFAKRSARRCRKIGDLNHAKAAAELTMVLHHPVLRSDSSDIDKLIETIERVERYCRKT